MVDDSMIQKFKLNLPQDLLSESQRQDTPSSTKLQIEGWRPSWLSKISEILVGKD